MFLLACRPPQDQEEDGAHVGAAGGGSETEESGLEGGLAALLRPQNSPPTGQPLPHRPLPPHPSVSVFTAHVPHGQEEEDADIRVTRGVSDAAEGGVEGGVQEVLRSQNRPPPKPRAHTVRTPAADVEQHQRTNNVSWILLI